MMAFEEKLCGTHLARMPSRISSLYGSPSSLMRRRASSTDTSSHANGRSLRIRRRISFCAFFMILSVKGFSALDMSKS